MRCPYVIKICTKCKRILVAYEGNYYKDARGKWGLNSKCRKCREEYRKENNSSCSGMSDDSSGIVMERSIASTGIRKNGQFRILSDCRRPGGMSVKSKQCSFRG